MIESVTNMMRNHPFSFEFKVAKKPKGLKIIYEVTQEEMDMIVNMK